jgi:hypothetical protein
VIDPSPRWALRPVPGWVSLGRYAVPVPVTSVCARAEMTVFDFIESSIAAATPIAYTAAASRSLRRSRCRRDNRSLSIGEASPPPTVAEILVSRREVYADLRDPAIGRAEGA